VAPQRPDLRIEGAKRAYRRAHLHLERLLEGLTDRLLQASLPGSSETLSRLLQHILNAESYWLSEVGEPSPAHLKQPDLATSRARLRELEGLYLKLLDRRGTERTRKPTPLWITLRVTQHTLYHAAQIALLRRLLGSPAVPLGAKAPPTWEAAVDEVTALGLPE
jgi:uncharacterized damage-inducible protein DinB